MLLKTSKPRTPGTRHYKYVSKNLLAKQNKLLKTLIFKVRQFCGKSSHTGHTTVWGRASGAKKLYRHVSFFSSDILGLVLFSVYDPNRTAFLAAVFNLLKFQFSFVLSTAGVTCGSLVGCKLPNYKYFLGFRYRLANHLKGSILSALAPVINKPAQYARAAGTFCQFLFKSQSICKVRLPSGQIISISPHNFATLGIVSNVYNKFIVIGKAGRSRLNGSKPKVRGIAMNPVDHPHGGRTNGGCSWVTPWGKPFRFKKTSNSRLIKIYKLL